MIVRRAERVKINAVREAMVYEKGKLILEALAWQQIYGWCFEEYRV